MPTELNVVIQSFNHFINLKEDEPFEELIPHSQQFKPELFKLPHSITSVYFANENFPRGDQIQTHPSQTFRRIINGQPTLRH
jgi:hypothetical protein